VAYANKSVKIKSDKFSARATKMSFVGFQSKSKTNYRLLDVGTKSILETPHATLDESQVYKDMETISDAQDKITDDNMESELLPENTFQEISNQQDATNDNEESEILPENIFQGVLNSEDEEAQQVSVLTTASGRPLRNINRPDYRMLNNPQSQSKTNPTILSQLIVMSAMSNAVGEQGDPITFQEALTRADAEMLRETVDSELRAPTPLN
jgi:hypothetical protein